MNSQQTLLCAKLAVLFLLGGCYTPSPPNMAEFRSIAINIENKTFEHGIEILLIKKVRNEFISDGRLDFAENDTDIKLCGQITSYIEDKRAGEYHVIVKGLFTLKDLQANRVLWENKAIGGSSVAPTSYEAKKMALTDMSRSVVRKALDVLAQ